MISNRLILGILWTSIAATIFVAAILAIPIKKTNEGLVFIEGQEISVIIADTPLLWERGLSYRKKLGINEGMLFVFSKPQKYGFWMKDMRFSTDIIFFDENRIVVDVWENAAPSTYPKIFTPTSPAKYVLEVRSGFFADHALKVGNILEITR